MRIAVLGGILGLSLVTLPFGAPQADFHDGHFRWETRERFAGSWHRGYECDEKGPVDKHRHKRGQHDYRVAYKGKGGPPPWAPAYGHRSKRCRRYRRPTFGAPSSVVYYGWRREQVGTVIGGATGGLLGNQIGRGTGRTAAIIGGTVFGALVGGSVGRSMDRMDQLWVGQTLERSLPLMRGLSKWPAVGTRKGQELLQLDPTRRAHAVGGQPSSCAGRDEDVLSRRRFFRRVAEGAVALSIPSTLFAGNAQVVDETGGNGGPSSHPDTVQVMEAAYYAELVAHLHYQVFSRIALLEGYPNIAYLFVALGTSEFVHANKFKRVLSDLAAEPGDMSPLTLNTSTTKANLEKAARNELEKIDVMYPSFVRRIQPEGHKDSLRYSGYAWESHKQHRHHIQKIERWVGAFFGAVAKRLETQTGPYFVCTNCGSTVTELPVDVCQICQDHVHLHTEIARPTG